MSAYIAPLLNEGSILAFGDDFGGGFIRKPTPILVLNYYPSRPLWTFII